MTVTNTKTNEGKAEGQQYPKEVTNNVGFFNADDYSGVYCGVITPIHAPFHLVAIPESEQAKGKNPPHYRIMRYSEHEGDQFQFGFAWGPSSHTGSWRLKFAHVADQNYVVNANTAPHLDNPGLHDILVNGSGVRKKGR